MSVFDSTAGRMPVFQVLEIDTKPFTAPTDEDVVIIGIRYLDTTKTETGEEKVIGFAIPPGHARGIGKHIADTDLG